jgi:hypothetical protein
MKLVLDNPYRIVGLLSGASAREQDRQIRRIKQFVEAEQVIEDDYSFPLLGNINRTAENIDAASSRLNLDSDKMQAALFWFFFGSEVTDEPAFNAVKEGEFGEAISIWSKLTQTREVTKSNSSAYNNLGTLYLCKISLHVHRPGTLQVASRPEEIIAKGIVLKLKFLESDFFSDFKNVVTDETYRLSKSDAQLMFLNQILSECEKGNTYTKESFLEFIINLDFLAKDKFLLDFAERPINHIENNIKKASARRKEESNLGISLGESLIKETQEDMKMLKSILGAANIKYRSVADKLANEIIQCSIDYYNFYHRNNSGYNFVDPALALANKAFQIAEGSVVKDKVSDTLETYKKKKDYEISSAIEILQHIRDTNESNRKSGSSRKIDWGKVADLIIGSISRSNVSKIKAVKDSSKILKYKELVEYTFDNLNTIQYIRVCYISFWKTEDISKLGRTILKTILNLVKDILFLLLRLIISIG